MIELQHNEEKCPKKFIERICKAYNAKFLGRFYYTDKINKSVYFFYCSNPKYESYSNYFVIDFQDGAYWIGDGSEFDGRRITTLKVNGKYYYSSDRHDFVSAGERFIDGGEIYVRTNSPENLVTLVMKDGEWYESTRFASDS